jgi:mono/diheme cytochrome c family protein
MIDVTRALAATLSAVLMAACGGGDNRQANVTTDTNAARGASPQPSGAASTGAGAAGAGASSAQGITPQMVAEGDSIFHGKKAGGICFSCHGMDGKGTPAAPNLTDQVWLDGDGSYESMVRTVTTGVPKPKQFPAPMPPMGGAALSPDQVRAVAAYEYSLSHKIE